MDGIVARVAAALLIGAMLLGGRTIREGARQPAESVRLELVPQQLGAWEGTDLEVGADVLELLDPDGFLLREYRQAGELPLQLYVDYHRVQRLGSTIHSPRICYPGAGWQPVGVELGEITVDGGTRPACWLRLRSGEREMLVLYWYESRWGRSARELDLKRNIVRSALMRRPADAALLRFATPLLGGDEGAARERIVRFVRAAEPSVRHELPFDREADGGVLETD
ncbi:MAG: exosortase C-terminal domain/associated protein EpsI [Candidatus Eiseniibacteriota bacterium]